MPEDADKRGACPVRAATTDLSEAEKARLFEIALERMVLIDGNVYGLEDDAEAEAYVDCLSKLQWCRALCCTYVFALTQEEVSRGHVRHNPLRPYYIARDEDGYCPHLDRTTYMCSIHQQRPLRCRKYACKL